MFQTMAEEGNDPTTIDHKIYMMNRKTTQCSYLLSEARQYLNQENYAAHNLISDLMNFQSKINKALDRLYSMADEYEEQKGVTHILGRQYQGQRSSNKPRNDYYETTLEDLTAG